MTVVSDTSVLCYLALLGKLDLLGSLFGEVVVPAEVADECRHAGAPEALRRLFDITIPPPAFIRIDSCAGLLPETAVLDPGEAAAISLAWEHRQNSLVLIDERIGRAVALALGLKVRGLLALLGDGHRHGLLDFDEAVESLRQHRFRVSSALLQTFRRELRLPETPP